MSRIIDGRVVAARLDELGCLHLRLDPPVHSRTGELYCGRVQQAPEELVGRIVRCTIARHSIRHLSVTRLVVEPLEESGPIARSE